MYGVFYATSFLDLYRRPHRVNTTSTSLTLIVDSDKQFLFLVSVHPPTPHFRDLIGHHDEVIVCLLFR